MYFRINYLMIMIEAKLQLIINREVNRSTYRKYLEYIFKSIREIVDIYNVFKYYDLPQKIKKSMSEKMKRIVEINNKLGFSKLYF